MQSQTVNPKVFEAEGGWKFSVLNDDQQIVNEVTKKIKRFHSFAKIPISAFYNIEGLTQISLPSSVTSIGDMAFRSCRNLWKITIPSSVTNVGDMVFMECSNLKEIEISESLLTVGKDNIRKKLSLDPSVKILNLEGSELVPSNSSQEIEVPPQGKLQENTLDTFQAKSQGTFEIEGRWEFNVLNDDPEILNEMNKRVENFPDFTKVPERAFHDCENLTKITIPSSVTSIGDWAFDGCNNLKEIKISSNVTSIGNRAFFFCENLTEITIPSNVLSIGGGTFAECKKLTKITIPSSVTSIGEDVFSDCDKLEEIRISEDLYNKMGKNNIYEKLELNFNVKILNFEGKQLNSLYKNKNVGWKFTVLHDDPRIVSKINERIENFPDFTKIPKKAFYRCENLTKMSIPSDVISIGESAFDGCSSLAEITIPSNITSIGYMAFYVCSNLREITIPRSVTSIGQYAFSYCSSLTEITIPNSVTSIGNSAFWGCENLTKMTIPNSVTSIGDSIFSGCENLKEIKISEDLVNEIGKDDIREKLKLNPSVKILDLEERELFPSNRSQETEVTSQEKFQGNTLDYFQAKSQRIFEVDGGWKFSVFNDDQEIANAVAEKIRNFPDFTKIPEKAFECCKLTEIIIPSSVTSIGCGAFGHCSKLTKITIPSSVIIISERAFICCENLKEITIPSSVISIGENVFNNCDSLEEITIPKDVTSIGQLAFFSCESLKKVTILGVPNIDSGVFMFCKNLEEIKMSKSLFRKIGRNNIYDGYTLGIEKESKVKVSTFSLNTDEIPPQEQESKDKNCMIC